MAGIEEPGFSAQLICNDLECELDRLIARLPLLDMLMEMEAGGAAEMD
jgi:hypothetical protein